MDTVEAIKQLLDTRFKMPIHLSPPSLQPITVTFNKTELDTIDNRFYWTSSSSIPNEISRVDDADFDKFLTDL